MYIAAFRCTIGAIQKALLGIMSKKDHSNGYQRMLSLLILLVKSSLFLIYSHYYHVKRMPLPIAIQHSSIDH